MPVTHKREFERIFEVLKKYGMNWLLIEESNVDADRYSFWISQKHIRVKLKFGGPNDTYISIFRYSNGQEYDLHDNGFAYTGISYVKYSPHMLTLINEHSFLNPMVYLRILELVSG